MEEYIKNIFEKYGGIMRTKELSEQGIHYRKLRILIEQGKVAMVITNGRMTRHSVRHH